MLVLVLVLVLALVLVLVLVLALVLALALALARGRSGRLASCRALVGMTRARTTLRQPAAAGAPLCPRP